METSGEIQGYLNEALKCSQIELGHKIEKLPNNLERICATAVLGAFKDPAAAASLLNLIVKLEELRPSAKHENHPQCSRDTSDVQPSA